MVEKDGLDQMGIADRIGALRLESGRSELELANELGRLMAGHRRGDLLDQVDTIEADVVRREPTLF